MVNLALKKFNKLVMSFDTNRVLPARVYALHQLKQYKGLVDDLAEYFKDRFSHWNLNGNSQLTCLYALRRMSANSDNRSISLFNNDDYRRVIIHTNPDKSAYLMRRRAPRIPCTIHVDKLGNSKGLCPSCHGRMRKLISLELVNDKTSDQLIYKILSLPDHRGSRIRFVESVRGVLNG